ncbi:MFS transporter [Streptococcus pneumoniae]|nr:MFS transporter [Streptococcus pneumoniae]MDS5727221.1 MFS transporter [Streptococcus pneumoniae]
MNNYRIILRKYPIAINFFIFNLFFKLSMYTSKTVHALWFEMNDRLPNYGLSYSAMAFAGIFSFYIGKKIGRFTPQRVIQCGLILYSIGLFFRMFPNNSGISIISGFVSGIGASVVLLLIRVWIVGIGSEEERSSIVSLKEFADGVGSSLGMLLAGFLVWILTFLFQNATQLTLLFSSVLCLITVFLIPPITQSHNESGDLEKAEFKHFAKARTLLVGTIIFGFIMGGSVSLFAPYLPVILSKQGINVSVIGVTLTILGLLSTYFSSLFSGQKTSKYKEYIFVVSEILVGLSTALLIFNMQFLYLFLILMCRALFLNGSVISQELMELDMYPKEQISYFYGISQTSYFIGDSLGGLLGGNLYANDLQKTLIIFFIISTINAISLFLFYKYMKK